MIRYIITILTSCILLLVGVPSVSAAAYGDDDDWTRLSDDIWQGLCVGASLDLSRASEVSCARQARAAEAKSRAHPAQPPNIGAGLCVGASLDLSRASAASCTRQFPPSATSPYQSQKTTSSRSKPHKNSTTYTYSRSQSNKTYPSRGTDNMMRYAALGDSIAAGLGLGSGPMNSGECASSDLAYPTAVGKSRGLFVDNLACSGATMRSVGTKQVAEAFAGSSPELITISAGANDVRWQYFLHKCYLGTCGTEFDTEITDRLMAKLYDTTSEALDEIQQRSDGHPPEVIVVGYYNPLSASSGQSGPSGITDEEVAWIAAQTANLNQTLEQASSNYSFADLAPVDFNGHGLFSSDPWVQDWRDSAPLHPTTEGQQAIARQIL